MQMQYVIDYIISIKLMGITSRMPIIGLALLALLLVLQGVSTVKPIPKCQQKFFYQILPMIANESAILNLDNLFDGYNLNFSLSGHGEWEKYINLTQKRKLQYSQTPGYQLFGLKSYHLEKIGNSWGSYFVLLKERNGRTYVDHGLLPTNTTVPVLNNQIEVSIQTNTICFDAVSFPNKNLIIVDCTIKHQKDKQGYYYTNKFFYFNISDSKPRGIIQNEMFLPFQSITRRKLQIYTQKVSGNTYLLRSYMYDGVDQLYQNNTYIDVHMMTDPLNPWVVSVIDRSFLRSSVLRIVDINVYLSEIYVLDYSKGIHRIRINMEQQLVYLSFYQAKQFNRFAIYSNNLDDRFEFALANNHEVLELDWTKVDNPVLLTKYTLMPGSDIKQLFLNYRFVVVFASSVFIENKTSTVYNYTWILNRGDRIYSRAFHVIKHDSTNIFIQFNLDQSYLMVLQQTKFSNYAIDEVIMTMTLKQNEDYLDKLMKFNITAISSQPTSNQTLNCSMIFNFTQVEETNRTMWQVGIKPSPLYQANYPGKVVVPIYSYAIGPNITYKITEYKKGQLKKFKIYQQDQLKIYWQKSEPSLSNIKFLRTESVSRGDQNNLHIYIQNQTNHTNLITCIPSLKQPEIRCTDSVFLSIDGEIKNWATITFTNVQTLKRYHIAAYTTTKHYNMMIIDDLTSNKNIISWNLGSSFQGNITNTQVYGKYLFVIRRYVKTIGIYNLNQVVNGKNITLCNITHLTLYNLGVKYFSPQLIQTSQFYPNVLFIKTSDSIIVLDLNTECQPKLLNVIKVPQNDNIVQFSFMLTLSHLIVTMVPNLILEYDLSRIYLRDIKLTKKYPLYGNKLPKNYDTDVSQYGNSIFVTTRYQQSGNYQVFIYRAGYPAVASLYDVIDLYTFEKILLDASGNNIDYLTVISKEQMRIFRQYEIPMAQIFNPDESYQFWLEYFNSAASAKKLELINVTIINLPTLIKVNPILEDIQQTKDLLKSGTNQISEINDFHWFEGSVLTFQTECADCRSGVVIVRNHIHKEADFKLIPRLIDYQWTQSGGTLQTYDTVLQMRHNGTAQNFIHLPQTSHSFCLSTTVPLNSKYQVSACFESNSINLYLVSLVSHKGFSFTPYSSKAEQLLKIQAVNQLLILVDTSRNPFQKFRPGGIFLYAVNFNSDDNQAFEQIQYLDYSDFPNDSDKPEYIVNADLSYHPQTNTYRLYITQLQKGIYQFSFTFNRATRTITLLQSYYINMPNHFTKTGRIPPYDSTYQSVKVIQSRFNAALDQSTDVVLLTTGVYHTVLLEFLYDAGFRLIKENVKKFFIRYAYYVVDNQIKYHNGFIVLRQTLPQDFDNISRYDPVNKNKSKQLITLYDVNSQPFEAVPDGKIPEVGLIGALMIMDRNPRTFDFNLTFNQSDPHREPRINLVVVQQFSNIVDQLSLHKNLTVFTKYKVDTQIIYLDLINDFDLKKIRILLSGWAPFPQWKLITIILFSIIGFVLLSGATFMGYKRLRVYMSEKGAVVEEQPRGSLVTQDKGTEERHSNYSDRFQERYSGRYIPSYSYS